MDLCDRGEKRVTTPPHANRDVVETKGKRNGTQVRLLGVFPPTSRVLPLDLSTDSVTPRLSRDCPGGFDSSWGGWGSRCGRTTKSTTTGTDSTERNERPLNRRTWSWKVPTDTGPDLGPLGTSLRTTLRRTSLRTPRHPEEDDPFLESLPWSVPRETGHTPPGTHGRPTDTPSGRLGLVIDERVRGRPGSAPDTRP